MTSRLKWYYSRLKTMNVGELLFRAGQARQRLTEKFLPFMPVMKSVTTRETNIDFNFRGMPPAKRFFIFGKELMIESTIDFHEDPFSNRKFPLDFSKTIDMRTDRYGSAKAVWEVNRLQFLLPLLINYKITGDKSRLDLFMKIVKDWDQQNPYMKGLNWYSNIEVNIRLINWYWCWLLLEKDEAWQERQSCEKFREEVWLPLIYKHCYYSSRNPSLYSSANNHLVAEYTGLFMATSLWQFPESPKWMKQAKAGLEKEIRLQHSPNGVNREEADAYIQFITDFFLQAFICGQQQGVSFSDDYRELLSSICNYIHQLLDIRDNIPGYGDNDDGRVLLPDGRMKTNNFVSILNTAAVLFGQPEWKRSRLGWDIKAELLTSHIGGRLFWDGLPENTPERTSAFFKDEGHFIFRHQKGPRKEFYCHFDAAPLGYLSIAAHGHADALSVIVHIDGYPILVDPGTYAYHTHQEWRKYFTSTLAHNTITIDKTDQAMMAGPTLWLNHFKTKVLEINQSESLEKVSASHDGYREKGLTHQRTVSFDKGLDVLTLTDQIDGRKGGFTLNLPFHLHPQVIILQKATNIYLLRHPETRSALEIQFDPRLQVTPVMANDQDTLGWYSNGFMKKEKSTVLMGELVPDNHTITLTTIIKLTAQS